MEPSIEHLGCGQMITKIGFMHYWVTWKYKAGADRHASCWIIRSTQDSTCVSWCHEITQTTWIPYVIQFHLSTLLWDDGLLHCGRKVGSYLWVYYSSRKKKTQNTRNSLCHKMLSTCSGTRVSRMQWKSRCSSWWLGSWKGPSPARISYRNEQITESSFPGCISKEGGTGQNCILQTHFWLLRLLFQAECGSVGRGLATSRRFYFRYRQVSNTGRTQEGRSFQISACSCFSGWFPLNQQCLMNTEEKNSLVFWEV